MEFVKIYIMKNCNDTKIDELAKDKLEELKQQDWEFFNEKLKGFKIDDIDYQKVRNNIYDNFIDLMENNFPNIDINNLPLYIVGEILEYIITYTIEYGVMVEINKELGFDYYSTESLTESIIENINDIIDKLKYK